MPHSDNSFHHAELVGFGFRCGSSRRNDGLANLSHFKELDELSLRGTQITDKGLKHLGNLKKLKILRLQSTNVSDAGVKKLQLLLPKVNVGR